MQQKLTGKLLHIHMPCSACPSLKHAIHWLLRNSAVSTANLTPHSLLQMKYNSSDLSGRSADRPSYLLELSSTRGQQPPSDLPYWNDYFCFWRPEQGSSVCPFTVFFLSFILPFIRIGFFGLQFEVY